MAEIQDLSVTDASNTGRWPENMAFSAVNDAGRADEGLLARWYKDTNGSVTASGSSNAFAITSNRTMPAYFDGLVMTFTANHSITGAPTLNLNGIGAKNIKKFNGDSLSTGDIISGQPLIVVYKASPDQWYMLAPGSITSQQYMDFTENASPGTPSANVGRLHAADDGSGTTTLAYIDSSAVTRTLLTAATQAQMEAATSNLVGASAARQHFHPGHPKAWVNFTGGTVANNADYGVSSITDNGTGDYSINWDTAFSSVNYSIVGSTSEASSSGNSTLEIVSLSTTLAEIATHFATSGGGRFDTSLVTAAAFGDQ